MQACGSSQLSSLPFRVDLRHQSRKALAVSDTLRLTPSDEPFSICDREAHSEIVQVLSGAPAALRRFRWSLAMAEPGKIRALFDGLLRLRRHGSGPSRPKERLLAHAAALST